MNYLQSIYHVEPGKLDEYLDIAERLQIPACKKLGLNVEGYWTTSPLTSNKTDVVAVYSFEDWATWDRMFEAMSGGDGPLTAAMEEYESKAQFLRPKHEERFLVPTRFSPLQ